MSFKTEDKAQLVEALASIACLSESFSIPIVEEENQLEQAVI